MGTYKVVTSCYANTYSDPAAAANGKSKNNTILMGSFVELLGPKKGNWVKVKAFSIEGWINKDDIGDSTGLKVFYVDVGQGDGALLEIGRDEAGKGLRMLIDGGPSNNMSRYLSKWQFKWQRNNNKKVHFDFVFISHFDKDHYEGLIDILNDDNYTFGTVYHNGICKFNSDKDKRPEEYNTTLGTKEKIGNKSFLTTSFDSFTSLKKLKSEGGVQALMERFIGAVENARRSGRLADFKRLDYKKDEVFKAKFNNKNFTINVLGPVVDKADGVLAYKWFENDAHTVNGHSLVLRIQYGERSLLFGGDLNIPAEDHLLEHYGTTNPFEVDVAKSCHHGASEFTVDFMQAMNPMATVISSGDNESYSHPRADAIGCAGKYSRNERPLVFSTELARSSNVETDEVKYGMINLRTNGENIIMAQMKEAAKSGSVWDLYNVI